MALSAFDSFCRGCEGGRFPKMDDRDDLWRVLFVVTSRKATRLVRREGREKRGGGRVVPASVIDEAGGPGADVMGGAVGPEPSPAFAAEVAEECRHLFSLLGDGELRQLAIWKMEGYTNAEIAARWDRSIPTVERKLARIRTLWERE